MVAADVVKAAAANGIKLTDKFVHTIRYNAKVAAGKRAGKGAAASTSVAAAPAKRGPGRPRKVELDSSPMATSATGSWPKSSASSKRRSTSC
jgi:hypothetical protein